MVDTAGEGSVGEYMGYVGLALNAGIVIAPLLGGLVFARHGYNAVFAMTFGLIALDILLRLVMVERHIPGSRKRRWHGYADEQSQDQIVLLESFPQTQVHMVPTNSRAAYSPPSSMPGNVSTWNSIRRFKWRTPPVIALLFSIRFLSALWGVFVQALVTSAFQAVLPLAVHNFFGWGSTDAGLSFIPLAVPSFFRPLVGRASDRMGPRWIATMGFVLLCPSLALLRFVDKNDSGHKVLFFILLAMTGCGVTLTLEPLMAEITYVTSEKQRKARRNPQSTSPHLRKRMCCSL